MTTEERDQLLTDSAQVRDEVINKANTATRVGTLFTNIVNFAYKAWLGITDETTYLLTPKPIRKGAGDEPDELASKAEVETEITTTVPTISEQFTVLGGQAFFATQFDTSTASNITFTRPRRYAGAFTEGEEKRVTKPSYSPVITVSKTNAKQRCKAELYHSGILVPSFLVPPKPSSPLATYADQAAMTADFTNQVEGEYYYYTGSTSAWLFDGTQTDSIDNYEEFEEITGWEEWGTKPEWLTVTGDAYLVGSDHMNLIKFTYYEFDKVGSDLYVDEVVCEVIAITNGNMDVSKLDAALVSFIDFNSNNDLVVDDGLLPNLSPYSQILEPVVLRSPDAVWVDLGSDRFALRMANNINNLLQSYIRYTIPSTFRSRLYALNRLSVICKIRSGPSAPSGSVQILHNHSSVDTNGFSFEVRSINTVRWRNNGNNVTSTTLSPAYQQSGNFFTFGVSFNGTNVSTFVMSTDASINWVKLSNNQSSAFAISTAMDLIIGNRADLGGSARIQEWKSHKIWFEALTDTQMETEMTIVNSL
jgi:hypothetical protein